MSMAQRLAMRPALVLGLAALALHLAVNGNYPIFRDELYYIVCGWHLDWGYMDQGPASPALAALSWKFFGSWMTGFRVVPALCFAACVVVTARLARLLGGGVFACWLAGGAVFCAAVLQITGMLLTTDFLQPVGWTACTYALVRAVRDGRRGWFLALGVIGGVTFLGKASVALHLGALGIGILLLPQRRAVLCWQAVAGAAILAVIVAPNLWWQQTHDWVFLAHMHDLAQNHVEHFSALGFAGQLLLQMGPQTALVWGAGIAGLAVSKRFAGVRWIGLGCALVMLAGWLTHGKPYYVAPVFPGLLAAGGVAVEGWLRSTAGRAALCGVILVTTAPFVPLFLPVLPPAQLAAYLQHIGLVPGTGELGDEAPLPQYFADTQGWQEFADAVTAAWRALPPAARARTAFAGRNYGEAAAIEVLGHGPVAISRHQSYWFWGPKGFDGSSLIVYGRDEAAWKREFRAAAQIGHTGPGWGMPYETNQGIWLCHDFHDNLISFWPGHMDDN